VHGWTDGLKMDSQIHLDIFILKKLNTAGGVSEQVPERTIKDGESIMPLSLMP
jgi:hypothetical protein